MWFKDTSRNWAVKVTAEGMHLIEIHFPFGDLVTPILFKISENRITDVLLGTSFIDKYVDSALQY